jgi:protein-disulfide isomerase
LLGGALVYSSVKGGDNDEVINLQEKVKGNLEATVVLSEYSDFQCPACEQFEPVVSNIIDEYGDKIRFEYHHFPLISIHPSAELAARVSEAAGVQGKFWEMHDLLFERQTSWSQNINPKNQFTTYAEELGLDIDAFNRHLNSKVVREAVQEDMREGRTLQINSTPTFYLNGEKIEITTYDNFKKQIEVAIGVTAADDVEVQAPATDVEFGF